MPTEHIDRELKSEIALLCLKIINTNLMDEDSLKWEEGVERDVTNALTRTATTATEREREEKAEILEALRLMYVQYCGEYGHSFMVAGEVASEVLEKHNILSLGVIGEVLAPTPDNKEI